MATTTRKAAAATLTAPDPVECTLCPIVCEDDTDLMIHLVEDHGAIWTVTNSFGLDDLMIPAPRESYEDVPVEEDAGWVRRLMRRTA